MTDELSEARTRCESARFSEQHPADCAWCAHIAEARRPIEVGDRVEIPTWSDWWMSGARYGTIEKIVGPTKSVIVPVGFVRLDSGRMVRFYVEELRRVDVKFTPIIDTEV